MRSTAKCVYDLVFCTLVISFGLDVTSAVASSPYCGMYSLYGAARALGKDVQMETLISPTFISTRQGSTTSDIKKAAASIGLTAQPLFGLGRRSLMTAQDPLILHVSPRGTQGTYTHWVLYLGLEDGYAMLHDGSGGYAICRPDELLARWDGKAIAITDEESPATSYLASEFTGFCFVAFIGIVAAASSHQLAVRTCMTRRNLLLLEMPLLLVVSLLLGMCFASLNASRSVAASNARRGIDASIGLAKFAEIEHNELVELLAHNPHNLIDSRYRADYERGSIIGAISLPVDAGLGTFQKRLKGMQKTAPTIIFCQSQYCAFSDYTASMLAAEGFHDVRIYRGGYIQWQSYSQNSEI